MMTMTASIDDDDERIYNNNIAYTYKCVKTRSYVHIGPIQIQRNRVHTHTLNTLARTQLRVASR